ncbi:unnamed protein product, partial [marine sediment metagenome]
MKTFILHPTDDLGEESELHTLMLHDETLGVTQRALKALRDELAQRIAHELFIFQVPATDAHCEVYGFFLVDKTTNEIAIIGDGFRGDGGGEGGAGHRAAQALLSIYGVRPLEMLPEDAIPFGEDAETYREAVNKALEIAGESRFEIPQQRKPRYVDWCFSQRRR